MMRLIDGTLSLPGLVFALRHVALGFCRRWSRAVLFGRVVCLCAIHTSLDLIVTYGGSVVGIPYSSIGVPGLRCTVEKAFWVRVLE